MDVWGHWGSHPECQADGAQAGSSRGLFSLLLLRTLVFKPFLKASCSAHALSLQFQHYLWPATHLCLIQVQESRLRLESSTKSFHETIFPIPHPQTPSFFWLLCFYQCRFLSQVALPCAEINKEQKTPSKQHKTQNNIEILLLVPPGLICHQPGRCWHWMRKKSYRRVGSIWKLHFWRT